MQPTRNSGTAKGRDLRFALLAVAVFVLAWALRSWFVLATDVEAPIRGDIREYVAYAWNLVHHGVFSMAAPSPAPPSPDAYRGPGYPAFLAAALWVAPQNDAWYPVLLHTQALLGSATCLMVVLTARLWLSGPYAIAAGLLLAVWPHHVVATGALLSEVLLGFLLVLATWLTCRFVASGRSSPASTMGAGLAFMAASLVNPIAFPLALIATAWVWLRTRRRQVVWIVLVPMLAMGAWQVRNAASVPDGAASRNRVLINFVQGSWPLYHAASNDRARAAGAALVMEAIAAEEAQIERDPAGGLAAMGERMRAHPLAYARWYLLEKPVLLWDWEIRIGAGDVYYHRVVDSPLETDAVLQAVKQVLKHANPWLSASLLAFVAAVLVAAWRKRDTQARAAEFVALALVYVTAVHVVLQAEPRYAIPYRPWEALACVSVIAWVAEHVRRRRIPASAT